MPLHPQAVQMVAQFSAARPLPLREMSLAEIRDGFQPGPPCGNDGVEIDEFYVSGPAGPVPVRRYVSRESATQPAAPVIIYLHGGGWVMGNLPGYDCLCRPLAVAAGAVVLSVGYSLSPEQRFPVAVEECGAVLREAARRYGDEGTGPAHPLIVAGDSAGGNLAAAVALKARDEAGPPLAAQLLIYPVLDFSFETPSYHENASGYVLTRDSMIWFWEQYLDRPADGTSPYASPLRATSLEGLPPAFVLTCEYDPLRDEGEHYAQRLHETGISTTCQRIGGMIHGYLRYTDVFDIAGETISHLGEFVRRL